MQLKPFQKESIEKMVRFLRSPTKGVYNASEMGLGKTIQAISAAKEVSSGRVLIICPAIVRLVWEEELRTKFNQSRIVVYKSKAEFNKIDVFALWHIMSYECARDVAQKIKPSYFQTLILDEAHYLKSTKSKRTKQILKHVWPKVEYKIALSGTPFTNHVIDGYSLFHKFSPEDFPDWYSFANQYSHRKHNGFGVTYEGIKNAARLSKIIKATFFIRYTKAEVLPELPPKTFIKIPLPDSLKFKMTDEQEREMEQYRADLTRLLGKDAGAPIPPPPVSVMEVRHEQARKKVSSIIEYVRNLLEQNVPVVLFCFFRDVLQEFSDAFQKENPAIIHGDTKKRAEEVQRFMSGDTNLFIGQFVAAGTGITLTRASNVVLAEYTYSPAEINQVVDRCHRIGQRDAVQVHYFSVKGSVDERIADIVMEKARNFHKVLNG